MDVTSYLLGKKAGGGGGSATLQTKSVTITGNGTTNVTPDTGYDGMDRVNITTNVQADLGTKTITENGTYSASTDNLDGYSEVTVNVSGSGAGDYFLNKISAGGSTTSGVNRMIKAIPSDITVEGRDLSNAFFGCSQLTSIPLIDTSNVTNMSSMCNSCGSLTNFPLLNTGNVTNMSRMFYGCAALKIIPLINTSNVTNMQQMFGLSGIETIPTLVTSSVTNFNNMCNSCSSLKNFPVLDFSSANSATSLTNMFSSCLNLTDESLNNILLSCISATNYTGTKTLKTLAFTSAYYSESRIEALPNYQDFLDAGWTTGY